MNKETYLRQYFKNCLLRASLTIRCFESQAIELALRCYMLNKINQLGMAESGKKYP